MASLQRAANRARETPRALIARTTRVPKEDLLRFLADRAGVPRFYYRSRGFAVAGAGIATDIRASGAKRFENIRDESAKQFAAMGAERQAGVPKDVGPVWMGGFSFEEEATGAVASVFPSARFILPQTQLRVQADGTYLTEIAPAGIGETTTPGPAPRPRALTPTWKSDVDETEWSRRVRSALQRIRNGDAEKVVLARTIRAELPTPPDLAAILGRFQSITPQSTVFLIEPEPGHAWLGASPELLMRRSQTRLETAALAGSRPRGRTPDEDLAFERNLRASSKDAWEHELVCRFIRSAFDQLGREARVTQDRGILKLPNVQHLETRFEAASTDGEHVLDVAQRIHPTPAVSGAPRDVSLRILRELEGQPRGWYAGAIGIFDATGDGELVVGIRTAHVHHKTVVLTAGCGIVNGSDPVEEWNESGVKFQLSKQAFDVTRNA